MIFFPVLIQHYMCPPYGQKYSLQLCFAEMQLSGMSLIIFPSVHSQQQCLFCSIPVTWSVLCCSARSGCGTPGFLTVPPSSYKCLGRGICTRSDNANVKQPCAQSLDDKNICYLSVNSKNNENKTFFFFFRPGLKSSNRFDLQNQSSFEIEATQSAFFLGKIEF